ncbi:DUF1800 domain-containing protein [Rhizobium skierniewicense]|nr:DUF1800 domain-containing protein [Rhizobium skierniewicense]
MVSLQTTGLRPCAVLCLFLLSAVQAHALSLAETRHLLDRTSFGMSVQDAADFSILSREQAVDKLLDGLPNPQRDAPPPFVRLARPDYWAPGWESRDTILYRVSEIKQLQAWWIAEMIETEQPFAEKLALFWHNHFVSRFDPGRISAPFYDQVMLFRGSDAMNFRRLTKAMLRDPMMLTSLDNIHNTRSSPNENLARELLELFTLGIGHYSESDIKQVAKVLAGHGVDRTRGWRYSLDNRNTDRDAKTVLGVVIPAGSDDDIDQLVDIVLAQPQVSRFIASKFYTEFVSLDVDEREVDRLATVLRDNDFEMKPFLRALLLSDSFWSQRNRAGLVKSPIELIVGFMRTLGLRLPDHGVILDYLSQLGQSPFMAPSVAGWRGGTEWLTMKSVEERARIVRRLWDAYDDARWQPASQSRDLFVRFSSEQLDTAAPIVIDVNGRKVAETIAVHGTNTYLEKASSEPGGLKPMWETFSVARDLLPEKIETITIRLNAKNPDTRLFVNWVAVDGRRFSPAQASWDLSGQTDCSADVPKGMFYCDVGLSFPIDQKDPQQAVMDDLSAPHNSIIEYGTGRLQREDTPRNVPTARDFEADASALLTLRPEPRSSGDLRMFLMSASAIYGDADNPSSSFEDRARMFTTDPAYNLK